MAILIPLSVAPSLASRRLIYATGVSNALFIIWLGGIVYAHARGLLNTDNVMVAQGVLSQDISSYHSFYTIRKILIDPVDSFRCLRLYISVDSTAVFWNGWIVCEQ